MRCPACHAKVSYSGGVCGECGAPLPQSCSSGMRPVSRLAYWISRAGMETAAVIVLCLLVFTGAAVTLSSAVAVYEPLTAAVGLDEIGLHTADGKHTAVDHEAGLLQKKAAEARHAARRYALGALLGLGLFVVSLLLLVRLYFISSRLRPHLRAAESSGGVETASGEAAKGTGPDEATDPDEETGAADEPARAEEPSGGEEPASGEAAKGTGPDEAEDLGEETGAADEPARAEEPSGAGERAGEEAQGDDPVA